MNVPEPGGSLRSRWPELRALLRWIVHSWFRPASTEGRWEQNREQDESRHVPFG